MPISKKARTHINRYARIYTNTYRKMHARTRTCIHTHTYPHTPHTHTHTHTYIHTYIYTNTYTPRHTRKLKHRQLQTHRRALGRTIHIIKTQINNSRFVVPRLILEYQKTGDMCNIEWIYNSIKCIYILRYCTNYHIDF